MYIYSTDTKSKVVSCNIDAGYYDKVEDVVVNMLLTRKHLIVFFRMGRIEWLNRYIPESLEDEEDDVCLRPLFLDRYY